MKKPDGSGRWKAAGTVVFNERGEVAIRKVKGGYGGYSYSFAKGRIEDGETDEQAARRETLEEMGHSGQLLEDLGIHSGDMSDTRFFLMRHEITDSTKVGSETDHV